MARHVGCNLNRVRDLVIMSAMITSCGDLYMRQTAVRSDWLFDWPIREAAAVLQDKDFREISRWAQG